MTEIFGIGYTGVWWAFGFLVVFCVLATPLERLCGRLAKGSRAVHLALDALGNCAILLVLDKVMASVSLAIWVVPVLGAAMAAFMVLGGSAGEN